MRHTHLLAAAVLALAGAGAQADNSAANDFIARYTSQYNKLGIAQLELSYKSQIEHMTQEPDLPHQRQFFANTKAQLAKLDQSGLGPCQKLDLARIGFEANTNLQKLDVLEQQLALGAKGSIGDQGLYALPLGQQWYAYLLKRWLTMDITPEQLMRFGENELAAVLARYHRLQATMGYAGRDKEFAAYLASPAFVYADGQTPQADYEARQAIVFKHLDRIFPAAGIAPALVRESNRGPAFPADAFYEPGDNTFYFNKSRPSYQRRNVDMLLLHESTPGHHYQSSYAREHNACPATLPSVFYSAYAEGWGAYVEEFGGALGLYRQPSDELGAVEWDLVRSIRVVLDVGINHEGWSHDKALAYWQAHLPMLPELAEREIARVRNWPVQAITYKLGAHEIGRVRALMQASQGKQFDLRAFHGYVLHYGTVPLALLEDIVRTQAGVKAREGI